MYKYKLVTINCKTPWTSPRQSDETRRSVKKVLQLHVRSAAHKSSLLKKLKTGNKTVAIFRFQLKTFFRLTEEKQHSYCIIKNNLAQEANGYSGHVHRAYITAMACHALKYNARKEYIMVWSGITFFSFWKKKKKNRPH